MAYDDTAYRRQVERQYDRQDETPTDPAAYRSNTLAAAEQRRRAEELEETAEQQSEAVRPGDDGRDRIGIHLGWEVVLLLGAAAIGFLLWKGDHAALKRPALDDLLIMGSVIGLLTLGAGLSLRAGVPNLALGPIMLGAAMQFAENGDEGLLRAAIPAVIIAAAGALAVGLVILVLHVPGWVATLGAALGVITYDQLRTAPVAVQGHFDPSSQAYALFGGFAVLAIAGGALGAVGPVRRWLGSFRPSADPSRRRGARPAVPVLGSLVLSSIFAVGAGVLLAAHQKTVVPGTGLEWSGIGVGLAMLAGTSAYGRRGGIFGTLFAVVGLTFFLAYADREALHIALFAIAAAVLGGGLIVTRLVETYGRSLPASDPADWNAAPSTSGNWTPDLPENWTPATTTTTGRTDSWDEGPWGSAR